MNHDYNPTPEEVIAEQARYLSVTGRVCPEATAIAGIRGRTSHQKASGVRRAQDNAALRARKEDQAVSNRERQRRWRARNPTAASEANRNNYLRSRYGITADDYDAAVVVRDRKCDLCGRPPSEEYLKLHVDHDHNTGKVRGLLCISCNTGLGKLGDTVEAIQGVLAYLTSPPGL